MERRKPKQMVGVLKRGKLVSESPEQRIATRKFIAESCEIAKRLNHKDRLLFLMRFESGFSTKEIAELCRVDETTVCRRIKQIAEQLNSMRNSIDGNGSQ